MQEAFSSPHCAELLKALADSDRLRLVNLLRQGPSSVSELAESMECELANVSHHLGILRRRGIVLANRRGRRIVYRLNPAVFQSSRSVKDHLDLGCCRLEIPK